MSTGQITPADIEANIASEFYFTAHDGIEGAKAREGEYQCIRHSDHLAEPAARKLTYCVLIPKRGDPITAHSLASDQATPAVERYIARQKAFNKLGELMAYAAKAALPDPLTSQTKGITA